VRHIGSHPGPAPGCTLNGDGDWADDVLQVYQVTGTPSRTLLPVGHAVTPCRLETCNPRAPYRVTGSKVRFLTFEPDQGADLDGNGAIAELVVQVFDACTGVVTTIGAVDDDETDGDALEVIDDSELLIADAGRCGTGVTCDPDVPGACGAGATCADIDVCQADFTCRISGVSCHANNPVLPRCILLQPGACESDEDCPGGTTCEPTNVVVATVASDTDGDGVPDGQDNCPLADNPAQTDGDGVGDACDAAPVGCTALPQQGCRLPIQDLRSVLVVRDHPDNDKRDTQPFRLVCRR
jgi:hypothetical protein